MLELGFLDSRSNSRIWFPALKNKDFPDAKTGDVAATSEASGTSLKLYPSSFWSESSCLLT